MYRSAATLKMISKDLERMLGFLPFFEMRAPQVSKWSIGQQLEHTTKVTRFALQMAVDRAGPPAVQTRFRFAARLLLLTGRFPKGRQAPQAVLPAGVTAAESEKFIRQELDLIEQALKHSQLIDGDTRKFGHPILGPLTIGQWLRFAAIHQRHHLRIIEQIAAAAG